MSWLRYVFRTVCLHWVSTGVSYSFPVLPQMPRYDFALGCRLALRETRRGRRCFAAPAVGELFLRASWDHCRLGNECGCDLEGCWLE